MPYQSVVPQTPAAGQDLGEIVSSSLSRLPPQLQSPGLRHMSKMQQQ